MKIDVMRMEKLIEYIDREIARSKSLRGLFNNMIKSIIDNYTKDMGFTERLFIKMATSFGQFDILSLPWDYAVETVTNYLENHKEKIKKIGMINNGTYKTVEDVAMGFIEQLEGELYHNLTLVTNEDVKPV